jgi:hypothetical protein
MKRWKVLLLVALVTVTLAGTARVAQLAYYRLVHIETALGINPANPDGQLKDAFEGLMNALRHIHDEMDENNETVRPLTEKQRTYETRLKSARD